MVWVGAVAAGAATEARAGLAEDLAKLHVEAIGGRARVEALQTMRMAGSTFIDGHEYRFMLWAARPNAVRIETIADGRKITQGFDGNEAPWATDSKDRRVRRMEAGVARDFKAEAEFDDPLAAGEARGVTLDFAGEAEVDGRPAFKILVTQNLTETSFAYVDKETFHLVRRDVQRARPGGGLMSVEMTYSDLRAVAGVLLPHRITARVDGKLLHDTVLTTIEANVTVEKAFFSAPVTDAAPAAPAAK